MKLEEIENLFFVLQKVGNILSRSEIRFLKTSQCGRCFFAGNII